MLNLEEYREMYSVIGGIFFPKKGIFIEQSAIETPFKEKNPAEFKSDYAYTLCEDITRPKETKIIESYIQPNRMLAILKEYPYIVAKQYISAKPDEQIFKDGELKKYKAYTDAWVKEVFSFDVIGVGHKITDAIYFYTQGAKL